MKTKCPLTSFGFCVSFALVLVLLYCINPALGKGILNKPEDLSQSGILTPGKSLVVLRAAEFDVPSRVLPPGSLLRRSPGATINVTYNGFPSEARVAFQYAVDIWERNITSPVSIEVIANWTSLGPGVLGSAGPSAYARDYNGLPVANTRYPIVLANKLLGYDVAPLKSDIETNFNSNFSNWYYGTDGNTPLGKYDLVSVVLHELCHGLGFIGSMTVSNGLGYWGLGTSDPSIYDRFTLNGWGQRLLDTTLFPNYSVVLATELQSNDIFFDGFNAVTAAGGVNPKLYAPHFWSSGSSYSHLDEDTYPAGSANALMTPNLNSAEANHNPGPIVNGIFKDMGWAIIPTAPTITTSSATSVTTISAVLNGTVNPSGASTTHYFEYGPDVTYGFTTANTSEGDGWIAEPVSAGVTGLTPDTIYHYRLVGNSSFGTSYGDDQTFSTTILYVDSSASCGGNTPCYTTIQAAINAATPSSIIKVREGVYMEDLDLNLSTGFTLWGGWNTSFTLRTSASTVSSITFETNSGTVNAEYMVVQ